MLKRDLWIKSNYQRKKKKLIEEIEKMEMGYSDDDIDAIFDGDLSASWSI